MFVDYAKIVIKSGDGGDGAATFRREKYVPMGGPFGGNGGKGSDIIFEVDEGLNTLIDLRYKKIIKGSKGTNGQGSAKHGANAKDIVIKVPMGTVITDTETNLIIADLTKKGDQVVVAYGGRGGRGNMAFATRANPAPAYAENGEPGEIKKVKVELKLLADVGLVGFPSVGKSTLISVVSAARPKIASYHFTTLKPNLGVVAVGDGRSFVMADLPGLIEGASEGAGLGIQFLKHIERTRVIVHIIDMSGSEGRNPIEDYHAIRKELGQYKVDLLKRPEIIVANKMDLPDGLENLKEFKETIKQDVIAISAVTKNNLQELLYKIADTLKEAKEKYAIEEEKEGVVEYIYTPPKDDFTITLDETGVYRVEGPVIKKWFDRTNFDSDSNVKLFARKLRELGVDAKLRELGVKDGDTVSILGYEFEFID